MTDSDHWKKNYHEAIASRDKWQMKYYQSMNTIHCMHALLNESVMNEYDELNLIASRIKQVDEKLREIIDKATG